MRPTVADRGVRPRAGATQRSPTPLSAARRWRPNGRPRAVRLLVDEPDPARERPCGLLARADRELSTGRFTPRRCGQGRGGRTANVARVPENENAAAGSGGRSLAAAHRRVCAARASSKVTEITSPEVVHHAALHDRPGRNERSLRVPHPGDEPTATHSDTDVLRAASPSDRLANASETAEDPRPAGPFVSLVRAFRSHRRRPFCAMIPAARARSTPLGKVCDAVPDGRGFRARSCTPPQEGLSTRSRNPRRRDRTARTLRSRNRTQARRSRTRSCTR